MARLAKSVYQPAQSAGVVNRVAFTPVTAALDDPDILAWVVRTVNAATGVAFWFDVA